MEDEFGKIQIRMSLPERRLFENSLRKKPSYLEFGCGGSTRIAVELECPTIVSVESDKQWITKLSDHASIARRLEDKTLRFIHVDIGPVGDWGVPKDNSKIKNWPLYCLAPFRSISTYSFILIDGRFRNSCAYVSWAHMSDDAIMAVHDYSIRETYFDIEKFFDVVDRADSLVLFSKKKRIIDESYVQSLLNSLFEY